MTEVSLKVPTPNKAPGEVTKTFGEGGKSEVKRKKPAKPLPADVIAAAKANPAKNTI